MDTVKLHFSKSFLLRDLNKECPDGGGIYFHFIKLGNNDNRIIYVGECQSFKLRQKEHLLCYSRNKYLLFEIENQELNIKYIPDYDSPEILGNKFEVIKEKTISNINVICGEIINPANNNLKGIEGAITAHLFKNQATRKFLISNKINYSLRNTEILFEGADKILYGLPNKIIIY